MSFSKAVVVNLSSSGSRLGGAAIAAEWHSRYMAATYPVELWRMWDKDGVINSDGLTIRNHKTFSKASKFEQYLPRQLNTCFLTSRIINELERQRPDIVHLQNPLPALAFKEVASTASKFGAKVVASTHGFFEVMNPNYNLNFIQKIAWNYLITRPIIDALSYMDAIVSGYPQEIELLKSLGVPVNKIELVPNGINPFFHNSPSASEIDCVLNEFEISQDNPILLFVGNHTANKGLDTVLKVAAKISKPVSIVIGGKCRMPNEAEYWCQKIPPADNVKVVFTDYLTLEQQRVFYNISTLLLFPSVADTLPLTILEAMASNLPVIAYDVGGISYQLENHSGLVVSAGNQQAFLEAIELLLERPDMRQEIRLNAKKRQNEIFTWDIAAKKTLEIYEN